MINLPIVISFDPGAGGRFIMAIFNFLLGFQFQSVANNGSAHNDDNVVRDPGNYVLMWESNTNFVNQYLSEFCNDSNEWKNTINFSSIKHLNIDDEHWHEKALFTTVLPHLNYASYNPKMISIATECIKQETVPYTRIIRAHIINRTRLVQILNGLGMYPTIVNITANTIEDIMVIRTLKDAKNHLMTELDTIINNRIANILKFIETYKRMILIQSSPAANNEFVLPFTAIRNKDVNKVLSIVKQVATHCQIPISNDQENRIISYINEYFSKQPVLHYSKEDLNQY